MRFKQLEVWQRSYQLTLAVYKAVKPCKDYSLKNQIQRCAVSVPSNIAEGAERKGRKEFIHFLFIAKGSCGEMATQLMLARDLNYLSEQVANELISESEDIINMLGGLIRFQSQKLGEDEAPYEVTG
ncbi:four helix bundle protein [Enterovibrio baiacu]|uniref:four helix bundle protein n=1 Tax=Enterovibrio baiacu TaxID=2491023 RepID=UPI001013A32D|nr:four helix bundle protein [Enterovibrio baiacu]MBE1274988.1 four helix bundle protein [Enterovibrio baiacu]